jgi:uncharacterized membrane protein YkvA (DUF1232 family)
MRDAYALYFVARHPRTPWYARALAAAVVAYALSPFDLIPDFVTVLGYLDDLVIVPLGIAVARRMPRARPDGVRSPDQSHWRRIHDRGVACAGGDSHFGYP